MAASGAVPIAPKCSLARVPGVGGARKYIYAANHSRGTTHAQSARAAHTTHAQQFASCYREPTSYDGSLVSVSVFLGGFWSRCVRSPVPADLERWRSSPPGSSQGRLVSSTIHALCRDLPTGGGRSRRVTGRLCRATSPGKEPSSRLAPRSRAPDGPA